MKVSIDGGRTFHEPACGVRIIYDDLMAEDEEVELHIHCTTEGIIMDVWDLKEREGLTLEEILGTSSEMAQEVVERLLRI